VIYYFTPYSTDKNLGKYYNSCLELIPDGCWACFVDGDAMFTTPNFGHQIQEIVEANSEFDLFTCMTNRVGTKYQCVDGLWEVEDMLTQRNFGKMFQLNKRLEVEDITNNAPLSGVLMLVKKSAWSASQKFKENGLLGVDNSIHYAIRNINGRVGLMKGVYVQHYYRGGNINDRSHLQ